MITLPSPPAQSAILYVSTIAITHIDPGYRRSQQRYPIEDLWAAPGENNHG